MTPERRAVRAALKRERLTGRYTFEGRFARLCTCGHPLGVHTAEAPHECIVGDLEDINCDCLKFRLAPKVRAAGAYEPRGALVDLYHVTAAANLKSIYSRGLVPGYASMSSDGSPINAVYLFDAPLGAKLLADKIDEYQPSAILVMRYPARQFQLLDSQVDPEPEFGGHSITVTPPRNFVRQALLAVVTTDRASVPLPWLPRVREKL